MTRDDFLAWRDHPVTQWVMKALEAGAKAQEAAWADCLPSDSKIDLAMLRNELATRADAYRALAQTDYADWCGILGEEEES